MTEIKSISVSSEFASLAKEHELSWSEAARIGMSILLGDKGVVDYDNNLNLKRKMDLYRLEAEKALQSLAELEEKWKQKNS
jgi:hypothetical protein